MKLNWHTVKRLPSAWLLIWQFIMLIAAPVANSATGTDAVSWALGACALVLVGAVIRFSPIFTSIGLALVVAALVLSGLIVLGHPEWSLWAALVEAAVYFYAALGMIMYMFADRRVTLDEIFAVGTVFTLLAWGFAFLYSACQILYPHSFTAAVNGEMPRTWIELLFLSFACLTSTGIGDIVPITPAGRVLASMEMFCGVMYVALLISRFLSMMGSRTSGA